MTRAASPQTWPSHRGEEEELHTGSASATSKGGGVQPDLNPEATAPHVLGKGGQ